jgi:hypothetical protein
MMLLIPLVASTGCIAVSELEHVPTPTPQPPDRTDCGEILGSAFRSDSERQWFTQNCSAWAETTLGPVEVPVESASPAREARADAPPGDSRPDQANGRGNVEQQPADAQQQPPANNSDRCNQMRGRPYDNPADREWYLQNCLNLSAVAQTVPGQPPQCAEMRGRPYESEAQRQWYLQNCTGPNAASQPAGGPDRTNCDEIRGTAYRSITERDWYRQNCG